MLDEDVFWDIIDLFDWTRGDDEAAIMEPAVKQLATMDVARIEAFEDRLAFALHQLDTMEHAKNIGKSSYKDGDEYFVVDSFLYARCLAVARGRDFYEAVLADPLKMPKDSEFESLLYLAGEAYDEQTGREFDYSSKISYETFANAKGWE